MVRFSRCLVLSAVVLIGSTLEADQDHFYEQQLQSGKSDFQANRISQAADELRIAAFGFLDKPPLLSEALVRLAVAQSTLGQDTSRTIERFIEVEQRFAPYASLQIESPVKVKFEELLTKSVPRATLSALPGIARVTYSEIENRAHAYVERRDCRHALPILEKLQPAELQQRPELYADQVVCFTNAGRFADAQAALGKLPDALRSRPDVVNAARLISAKLGTTANTSMTSSTRVAAPPISSSDTLDITRRLIHDGKYGDALVRLRAASQSDPNNRQLRLALLEAAVLARDFRTAATQVASVSPLSTGEELYMFYASVAMYETGRKDEARQFMQRARSRMVPSPMVDYYLRAILGQQG